jgi:hypothetical protein
VCMVIGGPLFVYALFKNISSQYRRAGSDGEEFVVTFLNNSNVKREIKNQTPIDSRTRTR